MASNGHIPKDQLTALPSRWSSHGEQEYLAIDAADSYSRMIARAVADTNTNFELNDAYRSYDEQVEIFNERYTPVSSGGDRTWNGQQYKLKPGMAKAAVPGTSNHGNGVAVDHAPSAIQSWMRSNAARHGWVNDVSSEAWHWSRLHPSNDQYTAEGWLDHAAVQKVVGAEVDGKIGAGTVKLIKEWQKEHGLTPDGKVGLETKKAMGLSCASSGKGDASGGSGGSSTDSTTPVDDAKPGWMPGVDTSQKFSGNKHKAAVTKIVLHTTEGSGYPDYQGGGVAPHFTVKPGAATKDHIRQHIPTTQSAKALEHHSGTVETNNAGCIQIEFVGSCDRNYAQLHNLFFTETADDDDLAALAAVVAWIAAAHDVPLTAHNLEWPTSNAAYEDAPQRMSDNEWLAYAGICGHTHVPHNVHWDPGAFPVHELLALAGASDAEIDGGGSSSGGDSGTSGGTTTGGKLVVDGRWGVSTSEALQRFLNSRVKSRVLKVDGRAAEDTWKSLQEYLSAPYVDGQISYQSHRPEELGNGIVDRETAWQYTGPNSKGSSTIEKLQRWVGVKVDGIVGESTTTALQRKLNDHAVGMN